MGLIDRARRGFSAFRSQESKEQVRQEYAFAREATYGGSRSNRSVRRSSTNDRTTITSVYTRLGIDVASISLRHMRVNENDQYMETIRSDLNYCLTVSANLDQGASQFRQDMAMTLFEEGTMAVVPVLTSDDPDKTGSYDIYALRVGTITDWYAKAVKVKVYNEDTGKEEEIIFSKDFVAVVENPLYPVMNEQNSTLSRIVKKLNLLDAVDDAASSGKLDILIQLPYAINSEFKAEQAEKRREELEAQMKDSRYGIGYIDGVERITQLNRPAENNMLAQIKWLMDKLYAELGLAQSIFDGTADEATMLNYHNRTLDPVLRAITEALHRVFLTKTAQTQGQKIGYIRDPFKSMPIASIAESADKLTRNEILSANEVRGAMGFAPSSDPKADELRNSNMPQPENSTPEVSNEEDNSPSEDRDKLVEETFAALEATADDIINSAKPS